MDDGHNLPRAQADQSLQQQDDPLRLLLKRGQWKNRGTRPSVFKASLQSGSYISNLQRK